MSTKFKIERVHVDGPHCQVHASIVEGEFFAVSKGSELGGIRLRSALHEASPTTFIFELETASDSSKLKIGNVVELLR
ncbi:MAG: hypothetical protein WC378_10475 [Opitutaceae bacterium]|jgi:hypothetical protein